MTASTSTLNDKYEKQFFNELVEVLEREFPKHKCQERGQALVLNSFANMIFRKLLIKFGDEIIRKMDKTSKI